MTTQYNAIRSFRAEMAGLKAILGWTNKDVAEWLGYSESTVKAVYGDPTKASGLFVLMVHQRYCEERMKISMV